MANVPAETQQQNTAPATTEDTGDAGQEQGYESQSDLLFGFNRLTLLRQVGLIVGLAASISLGVALVFWAQDPSYKPLLGDLSNYSPQEITEILDDAGIDYTIEHRSGALLVASGDLHEARLRLAREGVTEDEGMGFEMLMEDQGLGTSQFMEQARYHRSLEGELSRTITSMGQVRRSRVHLAIPRESVFVGDTREPSASVMVEVGSSRRLSEGQVESILNLVAGSVPNMGRDSVTVVDQSGNHLTSNREDSSAQDTARNFDIQQRVEEHLKQRVGRVLGPIMGGDRFNAEVSLDMDFSQIEEAEEVFNPDQGALRSERILEEDSVGGQQDGGVPGALANQPPGEAQVPEEVEGEEGEGEGEGGGAAGAGGSSRNQATRNFEVDRLMSFTRREPGSVDRLSVAVAVDDLRQRDPETGEVTHVEWPEEELQRLTHLIRDAVGYSAARGDSVTVVNTPFAEQEEVEFESPPIWEQAWFQDLIRPVVAGLVILALALLLVRPTLKSLAGAGRSERDDEGSDLEAVTGLDDIEGGDSIRSAMSSNEDMLLPDSGEGYDRELNAVKGLIAEDPARVAQVVRQWVNADE